MSIQALREQKKALSKEANNLLSNNGDKVWPKDDQTKFDDLTDQIERINGQIQAHEKMLQDATEKNFLDASATAQQPAKMTNEQRAMDIYLRKLTKDISSEEFELIRNTMSTTTGSEGGYTVQPEVATRLIESKKDFGAMRRAASQLTTGTGADLSYPTSDGTSEEGEIVSQNQPASDADISFGTVPLNVFKVGSKVVTVPIELLQDSQIDIQALINNRFRQRIGRHENRKFSVGSGSGEPMGLMTAAGVGKIGSTGQTTTISYDDLVDIIDSMDVAYLDGEDPQFMFGQVLRRSIRKIKDTSGRPIWTPSYDEGFTSRAQDRLMGYSVEINNMLAAPAANAKSLAFGSLKAYLIRDAMQVTIFKFEDSAYLKKGQVGFLAWARTGGNLLDVNAVKTYQHSAT